MSAKKSALTYLRSAKQGIKALAPFIRANPRPLIASALLILVGSIMGLIPAVIGGRTIDALVHENIGTLAMLLFVSALLQLGLTWLSAVQARTLLRWQNDVSVALKLEVLKCVHRGRLGAVSAFGVGDIVNRLDGDVDGAVSAFGGLAPLLSAALTFTAILVAMPLTNVKLALVGYCFLPLWAFTVIPLGPRIASAGERLAAARDRYITALTEGVSFAGLLRIKGFVCYASERAQLAGRCREVNVMRLNQYDASRSTTLWQALLMALAPGTITLFGAYLIVAGECTIGTLITFGGFFGRMFQPTSQLVNVGTVAMNLSVNSDRISQLLDIESECQGGAAMSPSPAAVTFRGVSFSYAGCEVFRNVSFDIGAHERVVLKGPSGAGKTTLLHLLLRYREPDAGDIAVGALPVTEIAVDALRKHIGYVPQDPQLFHGTIYENLTYGAESVSQSELEHVLDVCQLRDMINRRTEGLDGVISGQGSVVSGGQRQRIAIARTLLSRPKMLLLDEATSALEVETERRLFEALLLHYPTLPMIVVSHRPSGPLESLRCIAIEHVREALVA